jgi:hypothetical protein
MDTTQPPTPGAEPTAAVAHDAPSDLFADGLRSGASPLIATAIPLAITLLLTLLARALTQDQGFLAERIATSVVLFLGLLTAIVGYILGCRRALRHLTAHEQSGAINRARGARFALAITAALLLVPVLLAIVLPQHPAP